MVIGYDAGRAFTDNNGIGNYSRSVINNLLTLYPQHEYILYSPRVAARIGMDEVLSRQNFRAVEMSGRVDRLFGLRRKPQAILNDLKERNVRIFHGLSNEIPEGLRANGICSIVTIHETPVLRHPELFAPALHSKFVRKFRRLFAEVDQIVVLSDYTASFILTNFSIDIRQINTVRQGCNSIFMRQVKLDEKMRVKSKYGLPEKFILNVGKIEARNNLLEVAKSLLHFDESLHIVAVGSETEYAKEVRNFTEAYKMSHRLHILPDVPLADMPAIYQSATLFMYFSSWECFAVPVVEALYSGTPVISSGAMSIPEAGGADTIYVNYGDEDAVAKAVRVVLARGQLRKQMSIRGQRHVKQFENSLLAWQLMDVYRKAFERLN